MGNFGLRIRSVPPLDPEIAARVVSLTLAGPPADATHWTLDVLEGEVIGQCMKRPRHQEFIRFLNVIDARVPRKKTVHVIIDNYAAHKHPQGLEMAL